jgi:4'-phosphopantetheinyl transferase
MVTSDRHFRRVPHQLPDDVQIWLVQLDAYSAGVALEGLAEFEYARAARVAFARDGERFLASRHALRKLLAAALGRAPRDLVIEADEFGKLVLAEANALQFSLSRTADVALIGLSRNRAIGVDIEEVRTVPEVEELARDHFTVDERAEWSGATAALRDRVFLTCWTRKEAYLKAGGGGLSHPLDSFAVSVAPDRPAVVWVDGAPDEPAQWTLLDVPAGDGYAAALAVRARPPSVVYRRPAVGDDAR